MKQTEYEDISVGIFFLQTGCVYDGPRAHTGISFLGGLLKAEEIHKRWRKGEFRWFVYQDYTGFLISGKIQNFGELLQATETLFAPLSITEEEFSHLKQNITDTPELSEWWERFSFPSPWACRPEGRKEERDKVTLAEVKEYLSTHYLLPRSYWFFMGNFSPAVLQKTLMELNKKIPSSSSGLSRWEPPPPFREGSLEILSEASRKNILAVIGCRSPISPEVYAELYRTRFATEIAERFVLPAEPDWRVDNTSPISLIILLLQIPAEHYPALASILEEELQRKPDEDELSSLEQWIERQETEMEENPLLYIEHLAAQTLRSPIPPPENAQCFSLYFVPAKEEQRRLKLPGELQIQKTLSNSFRVTILERKEKLLSHLIFTYRRALDRWYPLDPFFLFLLPYVSTVSYPELRKLLWHNAMTYNSSCEDVFCTIEIQFPSEKIKESTDFLYQLVVKALFPPQALSRAGEIFFAQHSITKELTFSPLFSRLAPDVFFPDIKQLNRNTLLTKWRERVAPDNSTLFVIGSFDAHQVLEEIERKFSDWQGWEQSEILFQAEQWKSGEEKITSSHKGWWAAFPIPPFGSDEYWAFFLIHEILLSRLNDWNVFPQIGYQEILYHFSPSVWLVSFSGPEPLLTQGKSLFFQVFQDFREKKIKKEDWEKAKENALWKKSEQEITLVGQAHREAQRLLLGSYPRTLELQGIQKASLESANAVVERYLSRGFWLISP
ncbi:MAG: insulinase family protein [bacterium JZ-2024 1]